MSKRQSKRVAALLVLAMLLSTFAFGGSTAKADDSGNLTVVVLNILNANKHNENGKAVSFSQTEEIVPGASKGLGKWKNLVDPKGYGTYTATGLGYDYTLVADEYKKGPAIVIATEDEGLITTESVGDRKHINWITNKGNGTVIVEYTDGTSETFTDTTTLYISPVYKVTARWYLNYNYVDNISTGSGSWSNKDFVVSFSHTFKNPLDYTPRSHYQFLYWEVKESGAQYNAGETMTYTGAELPQGATKDMYVYAYYQPSVTVRYFFEGNKSGDDVEQFENIKIYDYKADHAGLDFAGWYDAEGNRFDEDAVAEIPEITKDPVEQKIITVYAHYNASITPEDNTKVYAEEDPELTAKTSGFAESDSVTYELERKAGEDVGKYTISVSDGASATTYTGGVPKYNITTGEAIFTITPKPITVTADDLSKIYGEEDPELTVTIEGLVVAGEAGDTSDTGEGTSETGEGTPTQEESDPTPNPAPDAEDTEAPESTETAEQTDSTGLITYTITREPGEDVGEYEITVTGEELQGNYQVTFVNGTFTIEPKEITVTPEDGTKVYGEKDPDLTATIDGLVEGDSEDLIKYELKRDAGENVGEYKVTASGEEAQGNYLVTYEKGTFTITPREVTVTADSFSKKAGEADPKFTAKAEGLVGSDTVTYTIKREAGEAAGTYKLTPEGEAEQGNYTVKYVEGTLTITAVEETPSGPDTGDHSNVMVLAITMGLSLIGIFAVMILKKEENRRLRRKDHARRAHS